MIMDSMDDLTPPGLSDSGIALGFGIFLAAGFLFFDCSIHSALSTASARSWPKGESAWKELRKESVEIRHHKTMTYIYIIYNYIIL